jgi:DNA-binding MarR family transcriptional regulator
MNQPAPQTTAVATRVWNVISELVDGQDRRRALRAALNLGPGKVEVLIQLRGGPMTLREIARAVNVDPPAATVGVDQLERHGLVYRTPHPDDKRAKLVHLTDAGHDAARTGQAILDQPPAELIEMDADDLVQLDAVLARIKFRRHT